MEEQIINAKLTESRTYRGEVSVQIMDDRKEVYSKKYVNSGMPNLFRFYAAALSGDWEKSKDLLPCKIALYDRKNSSESFLKGEDIDNDHWSDALAVSPYVHYDTTIVSEKVFDEDGNEVGAKSTLHFRIPFLYLKSNAASIYKAALYPTYPSNRVDDMCAYFKFTNDGQTDWNPINIPDNANNFTIIINWSLIIKNE